MRVARAWCCSKWLCEKNQITATLQSVPNVSIISRKKTGIWGPPAYGNGKVREICRTFLCEEKKILPRWNSHYQPPQDCFPVYDAPHTPRLQWSPHSSLFRNATPVRTITKLPIESDGPDSKSTSDRTGESPPRQRSDSGSFCSPLKPSLNAPFLLSSHA